MITKEYIDFFRQLESVENNSKEWFHAHKKEYEKFVKEPFLDLLEKLIPFVKGMEPDVPIDPRAALFRINRDVRFSKDKTPYNTLMKAGFSSNGKKSELPGFYLGISARKLHVGGGLFNVKPDQLKEVRLLIKQDTDRFLSIVENDEFVTYFNILKGVLSIENFDPNTQLDPPLNSPRSVEACRRCGIDL